MLSDTKIDLYRELRHKPAGVPGVREPADVNGSYVLAERGGRWLVTVQVPTGWLDDPARVWPVRVDPTLQQASVAAGESYKSDGTKLAGAPVRVGSPNDAGRVWRGAVRYAYDAFLPADTQVVDASAEFAWAGGGTANTLLMG